MTKFQLYTSATANPAESAMLDEITKQVGFLPNVFAVLGGTVPTLAGFIHMNQMFATTSLTALEREIVQSATSVENQCGYCVAGHSAFSRMQELDESPIDAIRSNTTIADEKLEALRVFTQMLVTNRGRLSKQQILAFTNAGYRTEQVFEVILGITVKTFSNLTGIVSDLPLDPQFMPHEWIPDKSAMAVA